jgi:hypothetical protein
MSGHTSSDRLTAPALAALLVAGITATVTILGETSWWIEHKGATDRWARLAVGLAIGLLAGWVVGQRRVEAEHPPRTRITVWLWGIFGGGTLRDIHRCVRSAAIWRL